MSQCSDKFSCENPSFLQVIRTTSAKLRFASFIVIYFDSSLHYTSASANCSKVQFRYGVKYMKKQYNKIHSIKYKRKQNKGFVAYIRGYRNREKTRCGTLFFNVEFRGIAYFYQVFCQQIVAPDCGQNIG